MCVLVSDRNLFRNIGYIHHTSHTQTPLKKPASILVSLLMWHSLVNSARARGNKNWLDGCHTHTHMVTCMHMVWRWCGACVNHCSCVCNFYAVTAAVQCTYMRRLRRQNGNDDDDIIIFVCWPVSRNRQPLSNLLSIVDSSRIFFFLPCIN